MHYSRITTTTTLTTGNQLLERCTQARRIVHTKGQVRRHMRFFLPCIVTHITMDPSNDVCPPSGVSRGQESRSSSWSMSEGPATPMDGLKLPAGARAKEFLISKYTISSLTSIDMRYNDFS